MALNKKPVTGMKDILPAEMQLRDYCINVIKETYGKFGFTSIETPCVESIGNLNSKQGGENEKLIFKILKRGEKLNLAEAKEEMDLVDGGLRYDLTVPLVRFYANHANELPSPPYSPVPADTGFLQSRSPHCPSRHPPKGLIPAFL